MIKKNIFPLSLKIPLIISFVGGLFGILFSLLGLIGNDLIISLLPEHLDKIKIDSVYYQKMFLILVMFVFSLFGVYKMWKRKKPGFYIYSLAQIILLYLFFHFFSLLVTVFFIAVYAAQLKHMNNKQSKNLIQK